MSLKCPKQGAAQKGRPAACQPSPPCAFADRPSSAPAHAFFARHLAIGPREVRAWPHPKPVPGRSPACSPPLSRGALRTLFAPRRADRLRPPRLRPIEPRSPHDQRSLSHWTGFLRVDRWMRAQSRSGHFRRLPEFRPGGVPRRPKEQVCGCPCQSPRPAITCFAIPCSSSIAV